VAISSAVVSDGSSNSSIDSAIFRSVTRPAGSSSSTRTTAPTSSDSRRSATSVSGASGCAVTTSVWMTSSMLTDSRNGPAMPGRPGCCPIPGCCPTPGLPRWAIPDCIPGDGGGPCVPGCGGSGSCPCTLWRPLIPCPCGEVIPPAGGPLGGDCPRGWGPPWPGGCCGGGPWGPCPPGWPGPWTPAVGGRRLRGRPRWAGGCCGNCAGGCRGGCEPPCSGFSPVSRLIRISSVNARWRCTRQLSLHQSASKNPAVVL
jgi:hypothetical protein